MTSFDILQAAEFECSYVGFVPMKTEIDAISDIEDFLKTCLSTVINGQLTDQFSELLRNNVVNPFVRLNDVNCCLETSKEDMTIFLNENEEKSVLGRYPTSNISFICPFVKKHTDYIAIHTTSGKFAELHVIMLHSREALENLVNVLECSRSGAEASEEQQDDSKSVQSFTFDCKMTPFFHSCLSEKQWTFLLRKPGDFLFRNSRQPSIKHIVLSYQDKSGEIVHYLCKEDPFLVLINFQVKDSALKTPILKWKYL